MNKSELAQQIAQQSGLTAEQAKVAVDSAFAVITVELSAGREVMISGFGKFTTSQRAARQGHNPATGETIQIKASMGMKFAPATALKRQLNP